jgi:DNA-binding transcriptional regulator YdaS (Cro superfamily)
MRLSYTPSELKNSKRALARVIREVGSIKNLAHLLKIHLANVSNWKRGAALVPYKHLPKLVELSNQKVTAEQLRPR